MPAASRLPLERSKPPGLQKWDLQRHGSDAVEYLAVADRAERYAQGEHGGAIIVTRIEKLLNPKLESAFLEAKKGLKSGAVNCKLQQPSNIFPHTLALGQMTSICCIYI